MGVLLSGYSEGSTLGALQIRNFWEALGSRAYGNSTESKDMVRAFHIWGLLGHMVTTYNWAYNSTSNPT